MKYVRTKNERIIGFEPKTKDLDLIEYLSQRLGYGIDLPCYDVGDNDLSTYILYWRNRFW